MTYGAVKLRMQQMFPQVSIEIIEGFIQDAYAEILGELPWTRMQVKAILQTNAPYSTGTVNLMNGSSSVTLTGGTWLEEMTGRAFRVAGRTEFYAFSFSAFSAGQLDRPYEGPTAAGAAYSIFQQIYPLPADARLLQDDAFEPLQRFTHGQLNDMDPQRVQVGDPVMWASYMESLDTPPRLQVELVPVPTKSLGLPFTYTANALDLDSTSVLVQIWTQPAALIEAATAKTKAYLKDYAGAQYHTATAQKALATMRKTEAFGMAPAEMRLDSYYTQYRSRRSCR